MENEGLGMDSENFVTQNECAERRQKLEEKFDGLNLRVVVMETYTKTAIALLRIIVALCTTILGSIIINRIVG